ncbi:hypothetical protein DICVIV_13046 [Dictyocaulus viviparus]|uniref:Uncharacterized protein n=1 Tax=Dictyocaulus viviparus TaxID=29172 RepID=A0A0D8X8V3_DICVI|nr:hypothetical protein DICVIV_13046 [Dictyocaulus viviparus]
MKKIIEQPQHLTKFVTLVCNHQSDSGEIMHFFANEQRKSMTWIIYLTAPLHCFMKSLSLHATCFSYV